VSSSGLRTGQPVRRTRVGSLGALTRRRGAVPGRQRDPGGRFPEAAQAKVGRDPRGGLRGLGVRSALGPPCRDRGQRRKTWSHHGPGSARRWAGDGPGGSHSPLEARQPERGGGALSDDDWLSRPSASDRSPYRVPGRGRAMVAGYECQTGAGRRDSGRPVGRGSEHGRRQPRRFALGRAPGLHWGSSSPSRRSQDEQITTAI